MFGVLLGGVVNLLAAWRQRVADDKRRWLSDRRNLYARYLGLVASMLQGIHGVALQMRDKFNAELDDEKVSELLGNLFDYRVHWSPQLESALGEIQLLGGEGVVDLADRMSGALVELADKVGIGAQDTYEEFSPIWYRALDLSKVLRNAMRRELRLVALDAEPAPRPPDWPWLANRPAAAFYEGHPPPWAT